MQSLIFMQKCSGDETFSSLFRNNTVLTNQCRRVMAHAINNSISTAKNDKWPKGFFLSRSKTVERSTKGYLIGPLPENLQRTTIVGDNFYFIFTFTFYSLFFISLSFIKYCKLGLVGKFLLLLVL